MKNTRIIAIVDDDPDDLELLTEALLHEDNGLKVRVYTSGKQLLENTIADSAAMRPDLFIVDFNMPEQSGADLIELLSQNGLFRSVPMLVLSTSDSPLYQKICREKGADHYFKKPDSFAGWVSMAAEMLVIMHEGQKPSTSNSQAVR